MDNFYGWEKRQSAVSSLDDAHDGRNGLHNATVYSLIYIDPDRDLPEEIRSEFRSLMEELRTATPKADEGCIRASIDRMDDATVQDMITRIVGLHENLSQAEVVSPQHCCANNLARD